MGAHSEKTHIPTKGTEKRNKMPGPQLTRDDLNSLLIFENLCNDWVREVHRFTSERKKKKNFVTFRNCENKKLTSLEGLKEELDDVSFLENAEFKSAFSHDIVSNKVGANKRARKAAKAWMADPKKQASNIAPIQEATPVEETAPVVEEVRVPEETPLVEEFIQESVPVVEEVIPDEETETEDIKSYEEVIIPVEDTPNDITEEELAAPVEEQVIPADEEQVKAPVEETLVVETDADEEFSIVDVKEDTNAEETKESVAAPLPTEDVPSTLPEVELVITQTSEETDQIEETPSIDIEEESVPIVKAETDRGSSVLSNTSDMGSMESLEAQTDSASTNSDDD